MSQVTFPTPVMAVEGNTNPIKTYREIWVEWYKNTKEKWLMRWVTMNALHNLPQIPMVNF